MANTVYQAPIQQNLNNGRITRDKLMTLRAAALREDPPSKYVAAIVAELSSFLAGMLAAPSQRGKHTMCKSYGHVIRGSFYSYPPRCSDCCAPIHSPDQLRKATPIN